MMNIEGTVLIMFKPSLCLIKIAGIQRFRYIRNHLGSNCWLLYELPIGGQIPEGNLAKQSILAIRKQSSLIASMQTNRRELTECDHSRVHEGSERRAVALSDSAAAGSDRYTLTKELKNLKMTKSIYIHACRQCGARPSGYVEPPFRAPI